MTGETVSVSVKCRESLPSRLRLGIEFVRREIIRREEAEEVILPKSRALNVAHRTPHRTPPGQSHQSQSPDKR